MPQIGWIELLLIIVIAVLVIGPKDFPIVIKKVGSWVGSIKRYFSDVQKNVNEITNIDEENKKETEEQKTNNKMIVKKLEKKLEINLKEHNINSPFYNEVIIIDEVHNFVRQITNNNTTSILFYEWILNSKNTKLICLSGTPIINKPCEIAILFNMIRGMTRVYNFTVKLTDKFDEITLSD